MAKIAIIGNSAAGFACCQEFLKTLLDYEIMVISEEDCPVYKKNLLLDYLKGTVTENDLFLSNEDFYRNNRINLLLNSKVTVVEPKKKRIILKDNSKINYDYLVIASGKKENIPDIPGKNKEGIFSVYNLKDAKTIKQRIVTATTICIVGDPSLCLRLWEIFALKDDMEIKIIATARPDSFRSSQNSEWIENLEVVEFIGEASELKAIKLSNGKIIGTPLVLFVGNYSPATEFLKESEIKLHDGYIITDQMLRTNFENIFACGSVSKAENLLEKEKSWDEAAKEGILAAQSITTLLGKEKISCQQNF